MKTRLIVIAVALIALLVVVGSQENALDASRSSTPGGPSFVVNVIRPWSARPLFGLLPGSKLRFDSASPGARVGSIGTNRLELGADGWDLVIETDGDGRVAPGTQLVFPIELAEQLRNLRCRIAEGAHGYLRTTPRPGSDVLDGEFLVELATCEDAGTGKVLEWPPAPLTVRGSFEGLTPDAR